MSKPTKVVKIVKQHTPEAVTPSNREFDSLVRDGKLKNATPFTCHILVDSTLASHILDTYNKNNRTISNPHLKKLTREMLSGAWAGHVGDEACIDKNGEIGNGQHRLMGIIKSETKQKMVWRFGVDSSIKVVEGKGRTKSFADTLMIKGKGKYATATASVINIGLCFTRNPTRPQSYSCNYKPSDTEKNAFYINNEKNIDSSIAYVLNTMGTMNGVLVLSTAAAVHWILSQSSNGVKKADEFMRGMIVGDNLPANSPIIITRNRIIGNNSFRLQRNKDITIGLMVKAYNDWIDGKVWSTKMHTPQEIPEVSGLSVINSVKIYE